MCLSNNPPENNQQINRKDKIVLWKNTERSFLGVDDFVLIAAELLDKFDNNLDKNKIYLSHIDYFWLLVYLRIVKWKTRVKGPSAFGF